jgi:hypothetical protein
MSLTGKYRYRAKSRWWTQVPLCVLQVEDQFRNDAPVGGDGSIIKYWRDAVQRDLTAGFSYGFWTHVENVGFSLDKLAK